MKVEKNEKELLEIGFEKIDKEMESGADDDMLSYYEYDYYIGDGRRGQSYHLLINAKNELEIYATKPDGSGCPTEITMEFINVLNELIK